MDRKAISFLALGVLLGAVLATAALVPAIRSARTSGAGSKTVLKLAHVLPPSHAVHVAMEFMARRATELHLVAFGETPVAVERHSRHGGRNTDE